ncbi:MAG: hypothetical protein DRI57_27625 [Deltaproteobacteria bacterium]|nr:MAG: hypothetical protein DRI57_27625 [Deltaproteobacteria bacterium]
MSAGTETRPFPAGITRHITEHPGDKKNILWFDDGKRLIFRRDGKKKELSFQKEG